MKVRTNHALIAGRQRLGRYAALAGLLILIGGLVTSFRWQTPTMIAITYVALIVGMILSSIGIYLADKWVQEPRADQALERAMKGFDDSYRLYNYVLPADHVLASPYGVMVFTVKRHGETVRYVNGKWKHEQSIFRKLQSLSRERLGDPIRQMEREVERLAELLDRELPDADIPISGAIVFTHPDVVLQTDGAPADVLHVKKLKSYIRRANKRTGRISDEVLRGLEDALDRD
ncbi:MAG: nuclease-related domain-containing protein [Anaerolineae bacterium]